jgi:hypothetical protein
MGPRYTCLLDGLERILLQSRGGIEIHQAEILSWKRQPQDRRQDKGEILEFIYFLLSSFSNEEEYP